MNEDQSEEKSPVERAVETRRFSERGKRNEKRRPPLARKVTEYSIQIDDPVDLNSSRCERSPQYYNNICICIIDGNEKNEDIILW